MNINEIKDLLSQFDQSTLTEFDLRDGSFELYFNKNKMTRNTEAPIASAPVVAAAPTITESAPSEPASAATPVAPVAIEGSEIVSPLVGVTYLQPSPDKPAFKSVGDRVNKGDIVCIVEAMKVMNEITSDLSGEIVEILVENEQVVEFNQPLFKVKEG
ncbi:MAG: acetyl-CoA carboxylase biotin carboxyl carrier protein [Enterococcus sp.]